MTIVFNLDPDHRLEDLAFYLEVSGQASLNLKPVMDEVRDLVLARNKRAYMTKGATTGRYWAPLRETTRRRKERHWPQWQLFPLIRTESMMDSLTRRQAPHQILRTDDSSFYLASTVDYASYHVTGTTNMPARPPMTVPKKHANEYIDKISDFIFGEGDYAR
jgi:phage gpG-like protein